MNQNGRPILAYVLLVVAIGCFSGMGLLQHRANSQQAALATDYQTCISDYQNATTRLQEAKSKHLDEYWQKVDFGPIDRDRALVEQALKQSRRVNPTRRLRQINDASRALGRAARGLNNIVTYLNELDEAQGKMATAPQNAAQHIKRSQSHIDQLVTQGYFERCFVAGQQQLTEAEQRRRQAVQQSAHYLEAFRLCQQADWLADQAVQTADGVLARRQQNEQTLANLGERRQVCLSQLPTARQAAHSLESYPNYRCLADLDRLTVAVQARQFDETLQAARYNNSLQQQYFDQAHDQLATAEVTLAQLEELAAQAVQNATAVNQARQSLPSARSRANDEIDRAERHIRSNSQNSQFSAKSSLSDAQSSLGQGDQNTSFDPPVALRHYQVAERQAADAYSTVDTSSDTSTSNSSGSSFGGSSSGSSGGSFGGGSGGSSSSGGSSGGSFGGSSSGSFGGSSSGSHGSGF